MVLHRCTTLLRQAFSLGLREHWTFQLAERFTSSFE